MIETEEIRLHSEGEMSPPRAQTPFQRGYMGRDRCAADRCCRGDRGNRAAGKGQGRL